MISFKNRAGFKLFCSTNFKKVLNIFFREDIGFGLLTRAAFTGFIVEGTTNKNFMGFRAFRIHNIKYLK